MYGVPDFYQNDNVKKGTGMQWRHQVVSDLPSTVLKFADDTKLYTEVTKDEGGEQLQEDLDKCTEWAKKWMMEFNVSKCKVLHAGRTNRMKEYTMEGKILEKVQEEKDLGVMVDKAMNGSRQVTEAVKKANRALAQLRRTITNKEIDTVIPIYKATVRPHLEYCVQAWAPYLKKDINALEKVQHRATKMITTLRKLPYEQRLKECNLTTLEERRKRGDMLETHKIMHGLERIPEVTFFARGDSVLCRIKMLPVMISAKYHSSARSAVSESPNSSARLVSQCPNSSARLVSQCPNSSARLVFPMFQVELATRF